jgi:predicted pyridoxine 5'-phosphate oxidase superfamily flavin-nucleotide-binding protein
MAYNFLDIAMTPGVRAAQAAMGSDHLWQDFKGHRVFDRFTPDTTGFIAARDSFYMASVSETGWAYVQHRGGPPGFLRRLDERTLGFADYRGNRQYISLGNLSADDGNGTGNSTTAWSRSFGRTTRTASPCASPTSGTTTAASGSAPTATRTGSSIRQD